MFSAIRDGLLIGGSLVANTTDNSNIRLQKRRKRDIKKRLFLIPKLIFVFLVVFLLISIFFRSGNSVSTYTALNGKIEEYVLADGYIFRDQELISSPTDGYFECLADEGDRVNDGSTIAAVYKSAVDPAVTEEISQLKTKIADLEKDETAADIYSANAVKIELNISEEAQKLTQVRDNNNFSDIVSIKHSVDDYIANKQYAVEGGKTKEDRLSEMKARLDELESSINGEREYIYAPRAGIFSSKIDGYEDVLGIEMMGDATPRYINGISKNNVTVGTTVTNGENVCKIIDNYEWYFVGLISEKEAENFKVDQSISIKFYDLSDSMVSGTVKAISKPEDGKVAITVYSTRYIDSIYTTSKVSAELLTESSEGIKVPSSSLRVIDGQQGVYVVRLGVARFVPVELLYNNKEWAIIKPVISTSYEEHLEVYDEIIINTKGIEDGKVVRQ